MNPLRKIPIYYGWWVLVSSVLIIFLSGMVTFGFPAFYPSIIETFGWSRTEIVLGNTFMSWTFGGMGLVWGMGIDKYGVRVVLLIGTICVALSYLLFMRMSALWELYAISLIFGAGLPAMGYLSNQVLQSRWFVRRRGLAVGVVTAASALGGAVAPTLITFLIMRVDWRNTMGLLDIVLWTIPLLLIILIVRERPESLGLYPDGEASAATTANFRQAKLLSTASVKSFREILLSLAFWSMFVALFFGGGTVGTTLQLLIVYLRDAGFSPQMAASALSLELGLSFIARLLFGALSDRYSARRISIVSFVLLGVSPLLLFFTDIPGMLILFAVLHGLGHGGIVAAIPLMPMEAFGTGKFVGRLLAITHLAYVSGAGIMPVVASRIFDTTGSYGIGFTINSVMTSLCAVGLIVIGLCQRQPAGITATHYRLH